MKNIWEKEGKLILTVLLALSIGFISGEKLGDSREMVCSAIPHYANHPGGFSWYSSFVSGAPVSQPGYTEPYARPDEEAPRPGIVEASPPLFHDRPTQDGFIGAIRPDITHHGMYRHPQPQYIITCRPLPRVPFIRIGWETREK